MAKKSPAKNKPASPKRAKKAPAKTKMKAKKKTAVNKPAAKSSRRPATKSSKKPAANKPVAKKTASKRPAKSSTRQATRGSAARGRAARPVPGPSTVTLRVGQKAPTFALPNQDGTIMRLADFAGKKVVLYFYPKDDTPGCTKESCAFRDSLDEFRGGGAVVLGISGDSASSHKKFAQKFGLNFPLLSDEGKTTLRAYGVWKEKSLYGRKFLGVERATFIINEQGTIDDIFHNVKVDGHVEEVLAEIDVMP